VNGEWSLVNGESREFDCWNFPMAMGNRQKAIDNK
jgi:hypothetical protein